jgi:hypothetical protein
MLLFRADMQEPPALEGWNKRIWNSVLEGTLPGRQYGSV